MSGLKRQAPVLAPKAVQRIAKPALGFGAGFSCLFLGAKLVYKEHPGLARLYLPPMAFAVIFTIGGWLFFACCADQMVTWFWAEPNAHDWWGLKHMMWNAVALLLWIALAALTVLLAVVLFSLVAAPFGDLLSERTEGILGTWQPCPFSFVFLLRDLRQTVLLELVRAGIKAAWLLPLFLLSLAIPVIGHALYLVLGSYLLAKFLGMDYIDWCMARRGWSWKERFRFVRTHRSAVLGLGSAVLLSLLIPFAFPFVWPAAVAGGSILFASLEHPNIALGPQSPRGD